MVDDELDTFGAMRFRGGRNEGQLGLPLEFAVELTRYEELVIDVARSLLLSANPERKRAPKNFRRTQLLRIVGIRPGSQVPLIVRDDVAQEPTLIEADYLQDARRLINSALRAVGRDEELPENFPLDHLSKVAQLGRSLLESESWELDETGSFENPAVVNLQNRRKLQAKARIETLEVEASLIGFVTGINASSPSEIFFHEWELERVITGRFSDASLFNDLKELANFEDQALLVQLSAVVGEADGEPKTIEDVLGVESVLPERFTAQIEQLASLQNGWLDGEGRQPDPDSIRAVTVLLMYLLDADLGQLHLYPLVSGGIQVEFERTDFDVDIRIGNGGGDVSVNVLGSDDFEREAAFPSREVRAAVDWIDSQTQEGLNGGE